MTGVTPYVLCILAAPVVWALGLAVAHAVRRRREEKQQAGRPSVAEIVARVAAERAESEQSGRYWPVAGYVPGIYRARDEPLLSDELHNRPTAEFPAVGRASRPLDRKPRPYPPGRNVGEQDR